MQHKLSVYVNAIYIWKYILVCSKNLKILKLSRKGVFSP